MKIVWSLNRTWTHGSYFSLCRRIHPERKVLGKCPG